MMTTTLKPTQQQSEVTAYFKNAFDANRTSPVSIFLNAVAGAGKTSTIMMEVEALKEIEKQIGRVVVACSVSFNTNIRDASQVKLTNMGSSVQAKTTNQLGRSILAAAAKEGLCVSPEGKADTQKYTLIAKDYMSNYQTSYQYFPNQRSRFKDFNKAVKAVTTLVTAVRNTRTTATEENLLDLVSHYDLQDQIDITAPHWPLVCEKVGDVIEAGVTAYNNGYFSATTRESKRAGWHDFDDQICLPLQLDLTAQIWDVIFIDEAQDLNRARLEMMTRVIKNNGILFFVGDPDQAIQGFTFSDTNSVQTIKDTTNAIPFPLTCCWRCDEKIIRLAQAIVPRIEARPNAGSGVVDVIMESSLTSKLETGYKRGSEEKDPDLVLCRVKAPLVSMCLETIRAGKAAIVRGRDIGRGIVALVEEILNGHIDFANLRDEIGDYTAKKVAKLEGKKDADAKIAELLDRSDTVLALLDGYTDTLRNPEAGNAEDFKAFIVDKFADDETVEEANRDRVKPIVFSTIHKAKGLEYDRVFILEPGKLPHPAAKPGWQEQQEQNIIYVAVTRAKHELYFVGGVPADLQDAYYDIKAEEEAALNPQTAVEEAKQIIAAPVKVEEVVLTHEENSPVVEEKKRGRKALASEDKDVKLEAYIAPPVKAALNDLVMKLQSLTPEEVAEILPEQEKVIKSNRQIVTKKVTIADLVEAALLNFAPFKAFFEASEHKAAYEDRKSRREQARQDYRSQKREKPAPAPVVESDDHSPDDDPDGNGGGMPLARHEEAQNSPTEEKQEEIIIEEPTPAMAIVEPNIASLFPVGGEAQIRRVWFSCLRPKCKKNWYADYYQLPDGRMYRKDDGGAVIWYQDDFQQCPYCNNERCYIRRKIVTLTYSSKRTCDSRCWNATPGSDCKCSCGGANHATGHANHVVQIGKPLLTVIPAIR